MSLTPGEFDLQLYRKDSDGNDVTVKDMSTELTENNKTLLVLSGDLSDPILNEYEFEVKQLEQHFRLFATSVVADEGSFD
ncbi:hypothetical protein [Paraglaciecola sp. L3A3]|uniref:hypothetical protein n=1 Tax=Paraglaciecola sp. L3A3 TaxID=2686358 RepID=UPI00131E58D7|nr:hypothetical protein [Paraglaciecola sp. L3A3]